MFTTCSVATNNIALLDDEPNDDGGLTPAQLKAKYDKFGTEFLTWFNTTHITEANGISGTDFLKDVNGYQKLPSGIIFLWGGLLAVSGDTITFPIAFPNACITISPTAYGYAAKIGCGTPSTTDVIILHDNPSAMYIRYIAIGY